MRLALKYSAQSHRGLVRKNNEDSLYAGSRLLALADGMGGHAAGEVASQLIIAALSPLDNDEQNRDLLEHLEQAVHAGNESIHQAIVANPDLQGMGTTLTALLFSDSKVGLVHIGDSRAYLLRANQLNQITKDDTLVQHLLDEGSITREEFDNHPQRSVIMKALTGHPIEPTLTIRQAQLHDKYLLCSDGLTDIVSENTIEEVLNHTPTDQVAQRLIELALKAGGNDNVTVVVAEVIESDYVQDEPIVDGAVNDDPERKLPPVTKGKSRTKKRVFLSIATILLLAVTVVGGIKLFIESTFYIDTHNNELMIYHGSRGKFLGRSFNKLDSKICIQDLHLQSKVLPESIYIYSAKTSSPKNCEPLSINLLDPGTRIAISELPNESNLNDIGAQVQRITEHIKPLCLEKNTPEVLDCRIRVVK